MSIALKYVKEFVGSCDVCARTKNPHHHPHGLLKPLLIPTSPWSSISVDFITNLPLFNSYDSILVVVDRLTKMVHFIMCTKIITSKQTTNFSLIMFVNIMVFFKISFFIMGLSLHISSGSDSLNF
jgi:hypothetical protein